MKEKRCNRCGEVKDLSEFHTRSRNKSGKSNACRVCKNLILAKYRCKNKEKVLENSKKQYNRNIDSQRLRLKAIAMENSVKITDSYVKGRLRVSNFVFAKDCTPQLIESKRKEVKLFRERKQIMQKLKELNNVTT